MVVFYLKYISDIFNNFGDKKKKKKIKKLN